MGGTVCKGRCTREYGATPSVGNCVNKMNMSKCKTCGVRFLWAGLYCPCCGSRMSKRTVSMPLIEMRRRNVGE